MRKAYEEYKATGIQWLPKIPKHWEYKKINSLFLERKTKVSDKDYQPLSVTKSGILHQLTDAAKSSDSDNRKLVLAGDFVINSRSDRKGSCGVSALDGSVSLINIVLEPKRKLEQLFVHYLLRCQPFSEEYYRYGRGIVADLWTTRYSEMKSIFLPIPPREEQEQIVRFLDWKISSINKLINLKQQEITELKELKKATISNAVTHGLDKTVPMKDSNIPWLGKIPQHWEIKFLSQISTEQKIKKPKDEMFPIMSLSYGQIIKKKNIDAGLVPTTYDNYQMVYKGNIILRFTDLQNDHTSLRTGLVKEQGIITSAYTNIKPTINSSFLAYLLHSYDNMKLFYGLGGGVRQSIGFKDVRYLSFTTPPRNEQDQIARFLDARCAEIDRLIAAKQAQITNLHDLKSSLIADVVTGQIDVRDVEIPDYEQVEETLYKSDDNDTLQSEDEIPEEV